MTKFKRAILVGALAVLAFDVAAALFHEQIALFVINARAGCFPWSPAEVEYHDGMTICPGQTARAKIIIEIHGDGGGSI